MPWDTETEKYEIHEKWHEKVFRPRGARAPEFLDKEPIDHYRKRLMTKAAPFVAADLQEVKTDHFMEARSIIMRSDILNQPQLRLPDQPTYLRER